MEKIVKTEEEWKAQLTEEEYAIARQAGTERPFTGIYWDTETAGTYRLSLIHISEPTRPY